MARKRRVNSTKVEIIQVASRLFLEKGVTNTSIKMICDELNISAGNLTFHFPTKEHLLAVLAELLCKFQWEIVQKETDGGMSPLLAICLELVAMAAICEENRIAKDFYISAYTHPMSLEIIRRSDARRAREVLEEFGLCYDEARFCQKEILISGIEYGTLMTTGEDVPLQQRIAGALEGIMGIFEIPEAVQKVKIRKALAVDSRLLGRRIFREFREYVENLGEQELEELLRK